MLITARSKEGNPKTRGVIGHATSENLKDWKVLAPLSKPDQGFGQMEVFQYEIVDGVPILLFCCGWRELGEENLAKFGKIDATYSVVVEENFAKSDGKVDFTKAKPFTDQLIYAGRLIKGPDGSWYLMGFINEVDGKFVGQLSDPIAVTATPEHGIVPKH